MPTNWPVDPTPTCVVVKPIKSTDCLATNNVTPTPKKVLAVGAASKNLTNGDLSSFPIEFILYITLSPVLNW